MAEACLLGALASPIAQLSEESLPDVPVTYFKPAPLCPNSGCGYSILKSLGFAVSPTTSSSPHGSDTP